MSTFDSTFGPTFRGDGILLVPNPIDQTQSINVTSLDGFYVVNPADIGQDQTIEDGNVVLAILIDPDDLTQLQSFGGSGVQAFYSVSPEDLLQDQSIDELEITVTSTGLPIKTLTVQIKEIYTITTTVTPKL